MRHRAGDRGGVSHTEAACASSVSDSVSVSAQRDRNSRWHSWSRDFALINNNICAFDCYVTARNIVSQTGTDPVHWKTHQTISWRTLLYTPVKKCVKINDFNIFNPLPVAQSLQTHSGQPNQRRFYKRRDKSQKIFWIEKSVMPETVVVSHMSRPLPSKASRLLSYIPSRTTI